jgi:hypothetical protein
MGSTYSDGSIQFLGVMLRESGASSNPYRFRQLGDYWIARFRGR